MKTKVIHTGRDMASFNPDDLQDNVSCSESDSGTGEGTDTEEDEEDTRAGTSRPSSVHLQGEPCRHYNGGFCRDGRNCRYLHFCKYALKGNCQNGSSCHLKHPIGGRSSSKEKDGAKNRSTSRGRMLDDGRYYQWQLDNGKGWMDIANDHIIEAQYSLPYTKGIQIYNTPYGAVSIDFKKMRVRGKDLRVRRLDDGKTVWVWYWSFSHGWVKYGEKDSKGNSVSAQSSEIEKKYQSDAASSFTFNNGSDVIEIKFREMRQVSAKKKRKVDRRPQYRPPQAGSAVSQAASAVQNVSPRDRAPTKSPQWQFEGSGGTWYSFKHRSGVSVTSADIETKYQQDRNGSMTFTVNGQSYKVDFKAMTQTQTSTQKRRKIRRVLS